MFGQVLWSTWLPHLWKIAKMLAYAPSYAETLSFTYDFRKFAAFLKLRWRSLCLQWGHGVVFRSSSGSKRLIAIGFQMELFRLFWRFLSIMRWLEVPVSRIGASRRGKQQNLAYWMLRTEHWCRRQSVIMKINSKTYLWTDMVNQTWRVWTSKISVYEILFILFDKSECRIQIFKKIFSNVVVTSNSSCVFLYLFSSVNISPVRFVVLHLQDWWCVGKRETSFPVNKLWLIYLPPSLWPLTLKNRYACKF